MGLDGAADLITLSNANVKITGTLDTTGYIKVASTKFTVDATGNTYADGTLGGQWGCRLCRTICCCLRMLR